MRIDSPADLITLCVSLNDNIYPSSSPTPTPPMCGCTDPQPSCLSADYSFIIGTRRNMCRAPYLHVPQEAEPASICPHRRQSAAPAQSAQTSGLIHSPVPRSVITMGYGKGSTRKERRMARLRAWAQDWLSSHLPHKEIGYACRVLLRDLDDAPDLTLLGNMMWKDYQRLNRR